MLVSRFFLRGLSLVLLAPLSAAGILTVGPAGSGAQFTEIQAAVDAAVDDDVILVKPGTYQGIVVNKPLRILGDGTGVVRILGAGIGARVLGIGAGRELVLSGVEVRALSGSDPAVLLQDCPGTVLLEDLNVPVADYGWTGVRIQNCARAVVLDSQISGAGAGALSAFGSEVWVANASLQGKANVFDGGAEGMNLENSTLHAWRTQILGGNAVIASPKFGGHGGTGLFLQNSRANLFGGWGSEIRGGHGDYDEAVDGNYGGGTGLFLYQNSQARIQASIFISGGLDGLGSFVSPDVNGDATSTPSFDTKIFPTLVASAQEVTLGSTFSLTLDGNPGGYQVLFLSLRTGPTTTYPRVDGFGLLDRASMVKVASEVLPPSGTYTLGFHVPNNIALLGSTLFFQAAEKVAHGFLLPSTGTPPPVSTFAIGNPVLVTITG